VSPAGRESSAGVLRRPYALWSGYYPYDMRPTQGYGYGGAAVYGFTAGGGGLLTSAQVGCRTSPPVVQLQ